MRVELATTFLIASFVAGCSADNQEDDAQSQVRRARATLTSMTGSTATGTMTFTANAASVRLNISIANVPPSSVHGFHIHAGTSCGPDGTAAGDHWNPMNVAHGEWSEGVHHLGDIGNIDARLDGTGADEIMTDLWTVGTGSMDDVVGRTAVLHANADDYVTQPNGNTGAPIACGVIQLME